MLSLVRGLALAIALLVLAPPLPAEDSGYRLQFQVCTAQGDLRALAGRRLGYAFGLHGAWALAAGNQLRPRLDLAFFPLFKLSGVQNTASSLSAGCDFLHELAWAPAALYLVGGASAVRWSLDSGDTTRLGLSAGVGLKVSEGLRYEFRYSYSPVSGQIKARTLGLGLACQF